MLDIMAHMARNWSRYRHSDDKWKLWLKGLPQAIRGNQETFLESSISLKSENVVLVHQLGEGLDLYTNLYGHFQATNIFKPILTSLLQH